MAIVCEETQGIMFPTKLSSFWSSLHQFLQEMDGATGGSIEGIVFRGLTK